MEAFLVSVKGIVELLPSIVTGVVVAATALVRVLPFLSKYVPFVEKVSNFLVKVLNYFPTVWLNPKTKELKDAYEALNTKKK